MGWRSRYEAMQRWAIRCKQCYSDGCCVSDDFVDFFLAFMVVCYHLKGSWSRQAVFGRTRSTH